MNISFMIYYLTVNNYRHQSWNFKSYIIFVSFQSIENLFAIGFRGTAYRPQGFGTQGLVVPVI